MAIQILPFDIDTFDGHINGLAELLHACVKTGASVGFVEPFTRTDAMTFWQKSVRQGVERGTRVVLGAMSDGQVAGSVQLDCDTPPNQPHRADVMKLLVHPNHRRQGIARSLMVSLEEQAADLGRTVLTLDTAGAEAEALYSAMGYQSVGIHPNYALNSSGTQLETTRIMYKSL